MDLLQSVRKDGSRGGRSEFKWEDVKNSNHRENYLGHSLMAPVGRWQKGKDLTWYSKSDDPAAARAARAEEIRKIKEAEEEAMAVALGLPVPARASNNANLTPLGAKEADKQVKTAVESVKADNAQDEDDLGAQGMGRGIGYLRRNSGDAGSSSEVLGEEHSGSGGLRGIKARDNGDRDRDKQRERRRALDRDRRRGDGSRSRSRSRSPRRHRHHHRHHHRSHRHRDDERDRDHRRHRHHDDERHHHNRRQDDRDRDRSRDRHSHRRERERDSSPREERRYRRERTPDRPRSRDSYRR